MRIAINAAYLNPATHDGIATYGRFLIPHLPQEGDEAYLYAPDAAWLNGQGAIRHRKTPRRLAVRNGPLAGVMRVGWWEQTVLSYRAWRDRADVLLSLVPEGSLLPPVPQVVVVHDVFPLIFPNQFGHLKRYAEVFLPRLLAVAAGVITVSGHTKKDLVARLGMPEGKIVVAHCGIDPLFFSGDPGVAPKGHAPGAFFLFVGRCHWHKNIETVLRAYAQIHSGLSHRLVAVVDCYGQDDEVYLAKLLGEAEVLGIREKLGIYSHLSRRELLFLYRNATALMLLSRYEGFGFPPLEAMAVGTPAIVSDSTALAEVAGPGAICVPNCDPLLAAAAMQRLATETDYRAGRSQAGAAHARQFTWERCARQVRSVLRRCCQ